VRRKWIVGAALGLCAMAFVVASQFSLSALPEPGLVETYVATTGKRWLVSRASRDVPQAVPKASEVVGQGE
jgi:hypothetical protein